MAMELDAIGALPANGVHADHDQTLVAEANATPPATPGEGATTTTIAMEAGDIVHLPAGTDNILARRLAAELVERIAGVTPVLLSARRYRLSACG